MRSFHSLLILLVLLALFQLTGPLKAAAAKEPFTEVFRSILLMSSLEQFSKVDALVPKLSKLPKECLNHEGKDLIAEMKTAIGEKDKEQICKVTYRLVFSEMLLNISPQSLTNGDSDPQRMRLEIKLAFLNYILLSTNTKFGKPADHKAIKDLFKKAIKGTKALENGTSRFSRKADSSLTSLVEVLRTLGEKCSAVYQKL